MRSRQRNKGPLKPQRSPSPSGCSAALIRVRAVDPPARPVSATVPALAPVGMVAAVAAEGRNSMFPAFLLPMLIGGGLGAATSRNPLKGALLGAGLGAAGGAFVPGLLGGGA